MRVDESFLKGAPKIFLSREKLHIQLVRNTPKHLYSIYAFVGNLRHNL